MSNVESAEGSSSGVPSLNRVLLPNIMNNIIIAIVQS